MPAAQAAERLAAAQSEVQRACDLLIVPSPEAWVGCQEALERAVSELSEFRTKCQKIPAETRVHFAASGLRAEVTRAAILLRRLAKFYAGWERILGAMSAGYTPNGNPAKVVRLGRLDCRG